MSFMVVEGKKFICVECERSVLIDYEGGKQMTQIGDFEVMRQQEIAEEMGESNVSILYDFGLCESCYVKTVPEEMREKSDKFNRLYDQIITLYNSSNREIWEYFEEALREIESVLNWDDISEVVGGISEDDFIDKRQHKSKRKSPLSKFVRENGEMLSQYIIDRVLKTSKIKPILDGYTEESRKILKKIETILKTDDTVYLHKSTDAVENLNEYIVTDTSVRVPLEGSPAERFYYAMEIDYPDFSENYHLGRDEFYLEKGTLFPMVEKALERKT